MADVNMLMEEAPKDRRILILAEIWLWKAPRGRDGREFPSLAQWTLSGERWVECFWYVPERDDGQGPRWMAWRGSERVIHSETITPIAWAETPGERLW